MAEQLCANGIVCRRGERIINSPPIQMALQDFISKGNDINLLPTFIFYAKWRSSSCGDVGHAVSGKSDTESTLQFLSRGLDGDEKVASYIAFPCKSFGGDLILFLDDGDGGRILCVISMKLQKKPTSIKRKENREKGLAANWFKVSYNYTLRN